MAVYTIVTTRAYEAALKHNYERYAEEGLTQEQYFQQQINYQVLAPMDARMKSDKTVNLTASLETVPEENQAKCQADIEADIIANGGTIVSGPPQPPGPMTLPPPTPPVTPAVPAGE